MAKSLPKVGLVCSEPLRETMAGIGIRYFELSRHLAAAGFEVLLVHPGETPLEIASQVPTVTFSTYLRGRLAMTLETCDVVVAQGQLANEVANVLPNTPKVFDFYDPWLIENLTYASSLGWEPFYNDLASWRLQFEKGDFFLCSSNAQRQYYLGFLTALGRINPDCVADHEDLERLIATVPFGIDPNLPAYQPLLDVKKDNTKRILFGGLYDWYDPWTLLKGLEVLKEKEWQVLFVTNPNPDTTPQKLAKEVRQWAQDRHWLGNRVLFLDWVPSSRRFDLLRDVDALVAPHRMSLETRLCMRTRYLDAIAVGCPVIASSGGSIAELLTQHKAGLVVPDQDHLAMAEALERIVWQGESFNEGMMVLRDDLSWTKALQPLLDFCSQPQLDTSKKVALTSQHSRGWVRRGLMKTERWLRLLFSR